ncbi:hypothetical protein SAMN05660226_00027 [Parapedobacter luteus]|uniref:Lipocalin-like domain-containing protein n=1 Tax=Parapedobacter luteus TaxID=623280 RepID=A0A1T4ZSY6_9SPHI|nr:lipocalin family protein [Parapedobacter luteus]SKB25776.1 hypothetical protein SAMN05660226_00027 [Parapedobacter luteus]
MKRLLVVYISVFAFILMGFTWLIRSAPNPERLILGQWKETGWVYERLNKVGDEEKVNMQETLRDGLVLHKAEIWSFLPNGRLRLQKSDGEEETIRWAIKGRGNILEIKYNDGHKEQYDLSQLADDQLVLNFELDTQVKGLAKLTFDRL